MSAKLQAPSQKSVALPDSRAERGATTTRQNPATVLSTGENLDMVVQSTLTETGQYTLRVMVEYRDHPTLQPQGGGGGGGEGAPDSSAASEPRSLRKFYRFKVSAPPCRHAATPPRHHATMPPPN